VKQSKQLCIPIDYFSSPPTDQVIARVLQTKLVIAFLPTFHDQTSTQITHYALFVFCNHQTCQLDNLHKLEKTLPDFPRNLLTIPKDQSEDGLPQQDITSTTSTPPPHNRRRDLDAFDYMLQSPAFYSKSSNSSAWGVQESQPTPNENPGIPSQISTISKRPHLSTGDTLHTPPKQKTRNHDASDSKTAPSTDSPSTTSNTNFSEHQTEHMDADDNSEEEFIPDSQYPFCLDHSQPTPALKYKMHLAQHAPSQKNVSKRRIISLLTMAIQHLT
jgi:hypothetical protein